MQHPSHKQVVAEGPSFIANETRNERYCYISYIKTGNQDDKKHRHFDDSLSKANLKIVVIYFLSDLSKLNKKT